MSDNLHRFLFDNCEIRGEHLLLGQSYRDVLGKHHYPPSVGKLLGEFLTAAGLLSAVLKFRGRLILQVRGDGEIPLIMAEATSERELRGIAHGAEQALSDDFHSLIGNGQLAITIEPDGGNRYQGIVSLEGDSLARCLETYFMQSEQLGTRIWLAADGEHAGGLLLQQLPNAAPQREDWELLSALADTLTDDELVNLDAATLLHRLYHEQALRLFEPQTVRFHCSCSQERMESALLSIGLDEVKDILAEQGQIESHCEFCHRRYHFEAGDIAELFSAPEVLGALRH